MRKIGDIVKTALMIICAFLVIGYHTAVAEMLALEADELLYRTILGLSGRAAISTDSVPDELKIQKCGTPHILSIFDQVSRASEKTKQAWLSLLVQRYDAQAPDTFGSPGGHFLIHYNTTGVHAVRTDATFPVNPGTGRPIYVDSMAAIFDSTWNYEINHLGYKPPPSDGFYPSGGDERLDIYLVDLKTIDPAYADAYGVTVPDSATGPNKRYYTSFLLLDNDFAESQIYVDRPLEIARVTAAHEFYHAVQFGYDAFEFENMNSTDASDDRHSWIEMSAVWMEEQVFDGVNDYYYYLPTFFSNVNRSLVSPTPTLYQYGAVAWPLYLSSKWGDSIILVIWQKCELHKGPEAFQTAIPGAIAEISDSQYTFATALSEFYIWDYFTGERARDGFGFEEASAYPMVPDSVRDGMGYSDFILHYDDFPVQFNSGSFQYFPDYLGGFYIRFSGFGQLDSNLDIEFEGDSNKLGINIKWNNRIVAYNPHLHTQPIYVDTTIYPTRFRANLDIVDAYDEVILVLSPYANMSANNIILNRLPFTLNVPDTSQPITSVTFSDPYPNPFVISAEAEPRILSEVSQPEPKTIKLRIFTLAGEKVAEKEFPTTKSDKIIEWDGRNDGGDLVASGIYLMHLTNGDASKVFKIAVIQ